MAKDKLTPRVFVRTGKAIHLGILVSSSVDALPAMTAATNVLNTLDSKLALVSTLLTVQCRAALSPVYELDIPTIVLPKNIDWQWWYGTINMLCLIDGDFDDPLVDEAIEAFNNSLDDGSVTYPFLHCHKDNNYSVEVI
jgi:hypothetical protein